MTMRLEAAAFGFSENVLSLFAICKAIVSVLLRYSDNRIDDLGRGL